MFSKDLWTKYTAVTINTMDVRGVVLPSHYCDVTDQVIESSSWQSCQSSRYGIRPEYAHMDESAIVDVENLHLEEEGVCQGISDTPSRDMQSSTLKEGRKYFEDCVQFLHQYSWLYDFQVTHFLLENQFEKIPLEWTEFLQKLTWMDLNKLPFSSALEGIPSSLEEYVRTCQRLSLPREVGMTHLEYQQSLPRMSPKKCHEILNMAELVKRVTTGVNSRLVVDVGAGLGYLSTLLAKELGLDVLALECRENLTHGTEMRCFREDTDLLEAVTFRVEDNEECFTKIENLVEDKLRKLDSSKRSDPETGPCASGEVQGDKATPTEHEIEAGAHCIGPTCDVHVPGVSSHKVPGNGGSKLQGACMIGLHCCGSLTPTMLKMLVKSNVFRSLICVGCCYHGMEEEGSNCWKHFPLSSTLKTIWQEQLPDYEMSVYGLRLAAQETRARWKKQNEADHEYHSKNVGFRALLELVCHKDDLNLLKMKRRLVRKSHMKNLEKFAQGIMARTKLDNTSIDLTQRLREEYDAHRTELNIVEPFTALQVCLQGVIESLILTDRVFFLQESGIDAMLVPLFDDEISPRNMAILAMKS